MKLLAILLLALAAPLTAAAAQTAPVPAETRKAAALAGSWALKVDGATIFRFDLRHDGDDWSGTWVRPKSFASSGDSFSRLSSEAAELASGQGKAVGEWVELTFPDQRPGAVPDVFRFRVLGANRVEMIYVETGLAPFTLVRSSATVPLGPFESGRVYRRTSVESLGLPPEPVVEKPAPAASAAADPGTWSLPPRRTGSASPEGGR